MSNLLLGLKNNTTHQKTIHYTLLFLLAFLVLFVKLGSFHMRMWDESMFAVNTYEMMQSGDYFSLSYNGLPDLYNTKPPLTNWLQLISVKLFGFNELAIRIPSATAAFLCVFFLFRFLAKYLDYIWAWIAALILLSSAGFISFHTARTGESDAILTLFLLLANLSFLRYLLDGGQRQILFTFLFLALAFATKLFAAFLFLPAYLILLLYFKRFREALVNWVFWGGLLFFLGFSFGLLYLREQVHPGYLEIVFLNDAGRLFEEKIGLHESLLFYVHNLSNSRFALYFLPLIAGIFLLFVKKTTATKKKILVSSVVLLICYLLIITVSSTKLRWYDMPLYPLLAIIATYPFVVLLRSLVEEKSMPKNSLPVLFILLTFGYPYYYRFSKSQGNKIDDGAIKVEANERYLHYANKKGENLDGLNVLYHGYDAPLLFYKYKLHEEGQEITLHKNTMTLAAGDHVLVCKDMHREALHTQYELVELDGYQYATVYLLVSKDN